MKNLDELREKAYEALRKAEECPHSQYEIRHEVWLRANMYSQLLLAATLQQQITKEGG